MKFRTEYYWLILFAFCFIAYQQIQDNIRPNYNGDSMIIKYILGVAPNFFPAIGIPAFFVVLIPAVTQKNRTNKWLNENRHITANIISLIGLISWEFVQMNGSRLRFDWNDVLWTIIGAFIFQLLWTVAPTKYKVVSELEK
jgi:hypothetical protein